MLLLRKSCARLIVAGQQKGRFLTAFCSVVTCMM